MRRGGTEVTAERLQNTIGLRCEGTTPERGRDAGGEGDMETWRQKGKTLLDLPRHGRAWHFVTFLFGV